MNNTIKKYREEYEKFIATKKDVGGLTIYTTMDISTVAQMIMLNIFIKLKENYYGFNECRY